MTIERLETAVHGPVLRPDDTGYDRARRVWNACFDHHPAAVVRCTGAADVMAAVTHASESGLLLAVRGGGHDYAGRGTCDDGVVLDLSPMKGVRVVPGAGTARVAAGATVGELDREAQAFGLATTAGTVSTIGVAGLPWAAAPATWPASTASPSTTSCPPTWSRPMAGWFTPVRKSIRICFGRSGAAAATSAWRHPSSSGCIPWARSWPGRSSTPSRRRPTCSSSIVSTWPMRRTRSSATPSCCGCRPYPSSPRPSRPGRHRPRRMLRRRRCGGRGRAPAAAQLRRPHPGYRRGPAVRDGAAGLRRRPAGGSAILLQGAGSRRPLG
jgi:FAD binding domain